MTLPVTAAVESVQNSSLQITRCPGTERPPELAELRRLVWHEETGLLNADALFNDNDRHGVHYLVYDPHADGQLVAATCAVKAEHSDFAAHSQLADEVLRDTMLSTRSTVHPDYRRRGLLSLLIYLGGREGRMAGRRWLAGYLERGTTPGKKVTGAVELSHVPPRRVWGRHGEYEVVATAAETDPVLSNCFEHLPQELKQYLREHCFAEEIVAQVMSGARRFYESPWCRAAESGTLTRWQYLRTLAEMHLYVRWTTRLLGTVVGICADASLRRHYLRHLEGEIDHEVQLEHDIAELGGDLDFINRRMAPADDIRAFMALQESLCSGLRRDPQLFMAVPFAMESLTAFLTQEFLDRLAATIASWGVDAPREAMTFLACHIQSDGGVDGHWDAARQILSQYVCDEAKLQEFLSTVRLVQSLIERAFTSFTMAPDLFAARPR
jgi:hypothetical protein